MNAALLTDLGWSLWAGSVVGCAYLVYAGIVAQRFTARPPRRASALPPISILKPLCGDDHGLFDNLASFCRQDYPVSQVVFGIQDSGDPAIAVVRRLMTHIPECDISLVVEGDPRSGNLKVANLQNMLPAARYDVMVIADSDMRVRPDYLAEVTAPLNDGATGLVTCLYRGLPAGGLWSRLACLHVNHGFFPQAVVAATFGAREGCFGATIALRRATLEAAGGLGGIAHALADDHALGAAVRRLGLKVVLSSYIVDNIIAEPSLAALFRHELRWARTIRAVAPVGFIGSVVTQPMMLAIMALALGVPTAIAATALALALISRALMVRMVDRALRLPRTPLWLMPPRDVLSFAIFIASFFARTVTWRDRIFRVSPDGRLIPGRR